MTNLRSRWTKLVEARHEDWTWRLIEGLYTEPHRAYHNLNHVAACLELLDKAGVRHTGGPVADLALFFHDIVYVPGDKRNEELSANLLRAIAPALRWTETTINPAIVAVLATQHHETVADDVVSQTVVDIDLSILGSKPDFYDVYVRAIRREFATVSADAWRVGRGQFLTGMLAKQVPIFKTTWGIDAFENQARENMRRELWSMEHGFVVKYKVGPPLDPRERTTEVYPTEAIAQSHADDIRGFEGVEYAVVEPAPQETRT